MNPPPQCGDYFLLKEGSFELSSIFDISQHPHDSVLYRNSQSAFLSEVTIRKSSPSTGHSYLVDTDEIRP